MGGTMRRGSKWAFFKVADSKSAKLYGSLNHIDERYRHRFQVNPSMVPLFENSGLEFVAIDKTGEKTEIIEIPDHRFFVGVQFHPEFKSRPSKPSALFVGLIAASCGQLDRVLQDAAKGNHEPEQNRREEKRRASDHLGSETCRSKRSFLISLDRGANEHGDSSYLSRDRGVSRPGQPAYTWLPTQLEQFYIS